MNREQRRAAKKNPETSAYWEGFDEGFAQAAPRVTQVIYCAIVAALRSDSCGDLQCARFIRMVDDNVIHLSEDPGTLERLWEQIGLMLERSQPNDRKH